MKAKLTDFNPNAETKLISLAMFDIFLKRSFYVELSDSWDISHCSDFALEYVIPRLDAKLLDELLPFDTPEIYGRMPIKQALERMTAWLESFRQPVQLVQEKRYLIDNEPGYDFSFFQRLFDGHSWPKLLEPNVIELDYSKEGDTRTHYYLNASGMCFQYGYRRYHALDEAKVMWISFMAGEERSHIKIKGLSA
jgi:hypothetical protein